MQALQETPLHWAASNDDVELVDALLDHGAGVEAPGSVIGGLGPIAAGADINWVGSAAALADGADVSMP
jgi:ankyrin repeat protein